MAERKARIARDLTWLSSVKPWCWALLRSIGRGREVYYLPKPVPDADVTPMRGIDELHFQHHGVRMLRR